MTLRFMSPVAPIFPYSPHFDTESSKVILLEDIIHGGQNIHSSSFLELIENGPPFGVFPRLLDPLTKPERMNNISPMKTIKNASGVPQYVMSVQVHLSSNNIIGYFPSEDFHLRRNIQNPYSRPERIYFGAPFRVLRGGGTVVERRPIARLNRIRAFLLPLPISVIRVVRASNRDSTNGLHFIGEKYGL